MALQDTTAFCITARIEIAWALSLLGLAGLLARVALRRSVRVTLAAAGGLLAHRSLARLSWSTASALWSHAAELFAHLGAAGSAPLQLGRYALQQKIGEGGMGVVYRALCAGSGQALAVKLLSGERSPAQLERFEREARLTSRLSHPNTIAVYEHGRTLDGLPYYAMELLDGCNLEVLVERNGPLPAGRAIHLLLQLCGALDEVHRAGLVHRDIKPANVYVCGGSHPADFVKLLDFGLVRDLTGNSDPAISAATQVLGTPLYLSPESIMSPDRLDARADIYAAGAVAYFLLCGRPPFQGGSAMEVCVHHVQTAPEPLSKRGPVASDLERIILACLAKDPGQRPASAAELAVLLKACRAAGSWSEVDAERWWQARRITS